MDIQKFPIHKTAFTKNALTVGGLTLGSRVLGFLRDVLMAAGLGAGLAADAFFVAFKLPNLFRRLFAEGAFSAAFVPVFSRALTSQEQEAVTFASQAMTLLFWISLGFVLVIEAGMPFVLYLLAPGFAKDPGQFSLALDLARITFPYLFFASLVALLGGILNSLGRFAAMAAAPILLNLCMIAALLSAFTIWPEGQEASHQAIGQSDIARRLAWAVCGAGGLQLVWMLVATSKTGIRPHIWLWSWSARVKETFRRLLPVALGAGVYQVNLVIDVILASFLAQGSISFLYYADRVNQLPLGVIGIAVGTTLLPVLSRHIASGKEEEARLAQDQAIEYALFFTLPAALGLLILAEPIIVVLFERGAFMAAQSQATAKALAAFSLGLPAYVLVKVFSPAFFARGDTATPVRVAVVALGVNLGFSLLLMGPLSHVGLALASSIAAWVNAGGLIWILWYRGYFVVSRHLRQALGMMGFSCICMLLFLFFAGQWVEPTHGGFEQAVSLMALIISGGMVYGASAFVMGRLTRRGKTYKENP